MMSVLPHRTACSLDSCACCWSIRCVVGNIWLRFLSSVGDAIVLFGTMLAIIAVRFCT